MFYGSVERVLPRGLWDVASTTLMAVVIALAYLFTVSWTTHCKAGWARFSRVNLVNQKTLLSS